MSCRRIIPNPSQLFAKERFKQSQRFDKKWSLFPKRARENSTTHNLFVPPRITAVGSVLSDSHVYTPNATRTIYNTKILSRPSDTNLPSFTRIVRHYSTSATCLKENEENNDEKKLTPPPPSSSAFATTTTTSTAEGSKRRRTSQLIPRKAAVQLTDSARSLFQKLLDSKPDKDGILLDYHQSSSGQPRMVFSFRFVSKEELVDEDEGVTLELNEDGTPKSPKETWNDGKPKLYVHHNAFMKVLGATVDVDRENMTPILYDREGNVMDPNA
ncbi:hypothetical protein IV203_038654 [Nitzschia inconspicua]|uniref:Uncharacterized protein n=1 Tax=Nitzschia inconspicua TaxID=303405 RepID=A0A9K3LN01_9STRA|nr:hypothetical protein IV203_038654 [Nitzschia inconspicua]